MRNLRMVFVACALVVGAQACGGDERSGDAGGGTDSGVTDARRDSAIGDDAAMADAGTDAAIVDAGSDAAIADASRDAAMADAGSDAAFADAGVGLDAGTTCHADLGAFCDDTTPCGPGLECGNGRCAPQDRGTCGGFAGWTCPRPGGPAYTACLYYDHADFGPCFTPAEAACVCARPDPGFSCP